MDETLRILRQAAAVDPSAKDRYIRALERVLGGSSSLHSDDLVELVRDMTNLGLVIGMHIKNHGLVSPHSGHTVIWDPRREEGGLVYRQGLALGCSTRGIAAALVTLYNDEFIKWSAEPTLLYDEVSFEYEIMNRYIYLWEITY